MERIYSVYEEEGGEERFIERERERYREVVEVEYYNHIHHGQNSDINVRRNLHSAILHFGLPYQPSTSRLPNLLSG